MNNIMQSFFNRRERGQSLVEVALFFPIFIIIIAGLVEVSNIVVTQNRVNNAVRVGARFGANGGENEGIMLATLNAVTQTLQMDEDVWDVWSIRGTINDQGTGFVTDGWEFEHVYGLQQTTAYSDVVEADIQQEVLEQLQTDQNGNSSNAAIAADIRFVGVYAIHDIDSILGLDAMPDLVGLNSVKALSVMRTEGLEVETTNGCDAFPIVIEEGIRSVLPPGQSGGDNRWPDWPSSVYPSTQPNYNALYANGHRPDEPFQDAREGYVYLIKNGSGPGQFGWLAWNVCESSATDLGDALTWPGNSKDYSSLPGGCTPGGFSPRTPGYVEPGDATDRAMHINDWIAGSSGAVASTGGPLQDHIQRNRNLRLLYYSYDEGGTNGLGGANAQYRIKGFVIMRLIAYQLNAGQGGPWIMAEFIRWDNSCGQTVE